MADRLFTSSVGQMRVGSLFSGYGGLDLAAEEVFNARTVWVSEINRPAARVFPPPLARRLELRRHHDNRRENQATGGHTLRQVQIPLPQCQVWERSGGYLIMGGSGRA